MDGQSDINIANIPCYSSMRCFGSSLHNPECKHIEYNSNNGTYSDQSRKSADQEHNTGHKTLICT